MSNQSQILQIRLRPKELLEEHPSLRSYMEQGWKLVEAHAAYDIRDDIYLTVCLELKDPPRNTQALSRSMIPSQSHGDSAVNCGPV